MEIPGKPLLVFCVRPDGGKFSLLL